MLTHWLRAAAGPPVRRAWICDVEFHVFLFGVLTMVAVIEIRGGDDGVPAPQGPSWVVALLPSAVVIALALARWWLPPRRAGGLAAVAVAVCVAVAYARDVVPPWNLMYLATLMVPFPVLLSAAVRRAGAPVATGTALLGVVIVFAWSTLRVNVPGADPTQLDRGAVVPLGDVALSLLLVLIPIVVGVLLRIADQRRRNADLARLRAAERLQVARELHDLIARHVTGMTMYAQAVSTMPGVPDPALRALGAIEDAGGDALDAMHRMVRTLRSDADPGLGSLDALPTSATDLVGAVQSAVGETDGVRVSVPDALRSSPAPADILGTVHRVVSEALTNVRRHAPSAREIVVELAVPRDGTVSVAVTNDGASGGGTGGGGFGLAGLRERVDAVGGTVHVGPSGPGRWLLRAELPWTPQRSPESVTAG